MGVEGGPLILGVDNHKTEEITPHLHGNSVLLEAYGLFCDC